MHSRVSRAGRKKIHQLLLYADLPYMIVLFCFVRAQQASRQRARELPTDSISFVQKNTANATVLLVAAASNAASDAAAIMSAMQLCPPFHQRAAVKRD